MSEDGSIRLEATNDEDGKIVFGPVKVTQDSLGSYPMTFTITETEGSNTAITYDGTEVKAVVTLEIDVQ